MATAPPPPPDETDEAEDEAAPAPARPRRRKTRVVLDHPEHGRIEVHHMRAAEIDAAAALADGTGPAKRVWIQIAKVGSFAGHPAGHFELTPKTFSDIVANFNATQNRAVPIDFEHASEKDPTSGTIPTAGAPAQGWIVDLDNRGDAGLFAAVEWGDRAREYIKSGAYRYISPAVRFASKDRVSGRQIGARLTSAGMTNSPFLDGLVPLAAKDEDDSADDGGHDDTNPGERDMADDNGNRAAKQDVTAEIDKLAAEKVALTAKYAELATKKAEADAEIARLKATIALRDEADLKSEVADVLATYADKLPTKDEATHLRLCKADPEGYRAMYPKVKPKEKHLLRDFTSGRPPADGGGAHNKKPEPADFAALHAKHLKAGKTNDEAFVLAHAEHADLLATARGL
jgi:phage I-like protein